MRKFFYIFAMLALWMLAGCWSKTPDQMMVGKFHISEYKCDKHLDPDLLAMQESITKSTFVEHLPDHKLVFTENNVTKRGTWELLGGDMQLKYELEGMKVHTMDVKEIGSDYFVIVIKDAPNSYTYITYTKD
ncbi:MAG: hypothetical protein MJZ66_07830 [Bacteroidales bacterium]|nr:hypothetical protein [Bacteroidales bacterium]